MIDEDLEEDELEEIPEYDPSAKFGGHDTWGEARGDR